MANSSFNVLANNNMSGFPSVNSKIEPSIAPIAKWALKQGFAKLN